MNVRDLNLKLTIEISLLLLETSFEFKNPFADFDVNFSLLEKNSAWTSSDVDNRDVEFISNFIEINLPLLNKLTKKQISVKEVLPKIKTPVLEKYTIFYEVWGSSTLTENYKTDWESYSKEFAKESIKQSYSDGSFDYWNGKYIDHYTDNFESDNFEVTDVEKINETRKTFLSKLIVENTSEVVDHLDMDTLISLRNIINQKLSSFL